MLATEPFHQFMTRNLRDEDVRSSFNLATFAAGEGRRGPRGRAGHGAGVWSASGVGLRDGIPAVLPFLVSDNCCGERADSARHDDAAAVLPFAAVQLYLLRSIADGVW